MSMTDEKKWKKVISYCKKHNIEPDQLLTEVVNQLYPLGYRSQWVKFRFDLYAKERIKQIYEKKIVSKAETIRQVINSKLYIEEKEKIGKKYKGSDFKILNKLIAEKPQQLRLFNAFVENGERDII